MLTYAERDVPTFPIWWVVNGRCACRNPQCGPEGKHPIGALVPRGVLDATTDRDLLGRWWARYPSANIGTPTTWCSVLDVDPRHGGDQVLADLEQRCGALPETAEVLTAGGGRHVYFAAVPGLGPSSGKVGHGLDIKSGAGAYVLLPPSSHVSGRIYRDEVMHPLFETPLAPMPEWLVSLATRAASSNGNGHRATPDEWAERIIGAPQGQRRAVALEIAGHYLGLRIPPAEVESILLGFAARCRPPFPEREARDLVRDLARRDQAKAPARSAPPPAAEPLRVPERAMVGIARDFADLYATYLEAPRSFFYFSFLTYLGSLIANKVTLASALDPEPRLYTVLLGESADTRKSTALRKTDEFFRSLGAEWEPHVLYGVGSAEGMAAELKEGSKLLLHYDEFKSFVDKAKAEHSVMLPMVATLFERGDYDNRTKTEKLSVRGASLSLLAACTVDTYATMFDQRFFAIGFLNRLFIVTDRATARIPVPKMIPGAEVEGLRQRVRSLLQSIDCTYVANGLRPVAYTLTTDAEEAFTTWYTSRGGSIFERRLDTYGHRLMLLLAATTGRTVVDLDIAEAVLALLRYQLDVRRECDPVDAENAIATLEEKIRRALQRGALKVRDLKRRVHYDRVGLWVWNTASRNLIEAGEVLADRAKDVYWLAPVTNSVTTTKQGLSDDGV